MIVRFTIGAPCGRQGSRTLFSVGRTALAGRPGQPYPATFHALDPPGIEPGFPACRTGVVPSGMSPQVRGVGTLPTVSGFQGWRITAFLPPEWTARDSHPHFRRAEPAPFYWTSSPVIPDGLEPSLPGCGPGVFAAGPRDLE